MSISPALYTFESIQKLLVTFRSSVSVSLTSLISSLLPSSGFILKMASLTSNLLTRFPFGSSPLNILTLWWVWKETKNKHKIKLIEAKNEAIRYMHTNQIVKRVKLNGQIDFKKRVSMNHTWLSLKIVYFKANS